MSLLLPEVTRLVQVVFANWRMGSPVGKRASRSAIAGVEAGMPPVAAPVSIHRFSALAILRWVAVAVAAGVLLAILGPFGSYMNGSPIKLAAYWIGAMLLGLVLYGVGYVVVSMMAPRRSGRWWPTLIAATLLASVPEALATRAGAFWLWPELLRLPLSWMPWFAQTSIIGLASVAGVSLVLGRDGRPQADRAPVPIGPAFEASLGSDVLALQMEDHYVRVHRPTGSELILLPLGRAIERVGSKGIRTHRSWWVASHAVAGVNGDSRSMSLVLTNGLVAPVARSAITHLKAAGWICKAERGTGLWDQGSAIEIADTS